MASGRRVTMRDPRSVSNGNGGGRATCNPPRLAVRARSSIYDDSGSGGVGGSTLSTDDR